MKFSDLDLRLKIDNNNKETFPRELEYLKMKQTRNIELKNAILILRPKQHNAYSKRETSGKYPG